MLRQWAYNQSPVIDIPATNSAPHVTSSAKAIRLVAYHRNPFMRQIQNPHEASDPYVTTSRYNFAVWIAEWGRVGLVTGLPPITPTVIDEPGKNKSKPLSKS